MVDSCSAGSPTAEVCDGKDNDCDGTVDEGCADLTGLWTSMAVKGPVTTPDGPRWIAYGNLQVKNLSSNAIAGAFKIKFYFVPNVGSPWLIGERSLLGLRKGATTNLSLRKLTASDPSGQGSVRAVIDEVNSVKESNELNNEATRNIP